MSALAAEHSAINLGQGFPDFGMDTKLTDLVTRAMNDGHNQYVHMNGLPLLRQRISEKVYRLYTNEIDPDSGITITPGGTYAIYTALTAIINKGDEVIVFEPAYDSYIPNIEINGGIAITVPLSFPGYKIDWNMVKTKVSPRTKAIIINSPHNPSGTLLLEEDIESLRSIVSGTGIFIISDEVYEHLVFNGGKHLSILGYPDLYERSFVCFSFGKVYHCTGWKLGYCIAAPKWMKEFRKVHQFNCFTCNSPMQYALAEYLESASAYLSLGSQLEEKKNFLEQAMRETFFEPIPSFGSYFQLFSYKNFSAEREADFAVRLVKDAGVATIPVSAFYKHPVENQVLRFCFAKKIETLEAAVERLKRIF